ncbi:hypothetical protein [Leptolyngbya sp. Cla-17]|uniref:hypothetical protein n=1 Tax=Leptolyngbya sp. Cla-17 TaxID=2803751 RepID=UPI001492E7F8|nr:hypothetical protein [Leptolyngbya sp. Cla-17]
MINSLKKGLEARLVVGAVATTTILLLATVDAWAETLKTKSFNVKITRNCPEGVVVCNNVGYFGRDLKTGQSIRLVGKTLHTTCQDGITPCRFLGYQFQNRNYRYFVREDGTLQVYQGKKLLLQERGTWSY